MWPDAVVHRAPGQGQPAEGERPGQQRVAAQLRLIYGARPGKPPETAWTRGPTSRSAANTRRSNGSGGRLGACHPVLAFPPEVPKVIHLTNMIESINYRLRKVTKTRGSFHTDEALVKLLYLGCREIGRIARAGRGGHSNSNWKIAMNQFDIMFPGRLDNA